VDYPFTIPDGFDPPLAIIEIVTNECARMTVPAPPPAKLTKDPPALVVTDVAAPHHDMTLPPGGRVQLKCHGIEAEPMFRLVGFETVKWP